MAYNLRSFSVSDSSINNIGDFKISNFRKNGKCGGILEWGRGLDAEDLDRTTVHYINLGIDRSGSMDFHITQEVEEVEVEEEVEAVEENYGICVRFIIKNTIVFIAWIAILLVVNWL